MQTSCCNSSSSLSRIHRRTLGQPRLIAAPRNRGRCLVVAFHKNAKRLKYAGAGQKSGKEPTVITVDPDGSDLWRLQEVSEMIEQGAVGDVHGDQPNVHGSMGASCMQSGTHVFTSGVHGPCQACALGIQGHSVLARDATKSDISPFEGRR